MGGLKIVHMGDIGQKKLTAFQRSMLGPVDILLIPIGGVTTLNPQEAQIMIADLNPGIVFPMHYGDIRFYKLAELEELDAGYHWSDDDGQSFPFRGQGITVPTVAQVFAAFPDYEASIDYVIAEGNVVVLRISETGTHEAEYMQIAPTGKKVKWSDTFFLVYDGKGKIRKAWLQANLMGLMSQIGGFKPQVPKGAGAATTAAGSKADINKAAFTRFIEEFWNERKFDLADELIHPEHFSSSIPTLPKGPQGMKIIAGVVAGGIFPDLQREIVHVFATDDMVGALENTSA